MQIGVRPNISARTVQSSLPQGEIGIATDAEALMIELRVLMLLVAPSISDGVVVKCRFQCPDGKLKFHIIISAS